MSDFVGQGEGGGGGGGYLPVSMWRPKSLSGIFLICFSTTVSFKTQSLQEVRAHPQARLNGYPAPELLLLLPP